MLKEAFELQEQMNEITDMVFQVSERFENIAKNIKNNSETVGKVAKNIVKLTKYSKYAGPAGFLASTGANLLSSGVSSIGKWFSDKKEKKLLAEALPRKQQIASEKKDVLLRMIPRLNKEKNNVIEFCKNEAATILTIEEIDRFDLISTSAKNIFEAYYIFEHIEIWCKFFLKEFDAWLKGNHYSNEQTPDDELTYFKCVNDFIKWSKLPLFIKPTEIPGKVSVGGLLLFSDEDFFEYAKYNEDYKKFTLRIAKAKVSTYLLPFSNKSKIYNSYFNEFFRKNKLVFMFVQKKKSRLILFSILLFIIITILILYLFMGDNLLILK
ncbi:MAG TPA: hypothetical protein PK762_08300 [Candidatus Kapabacteria bacterium]|nr:hypothetical protein [Candidatus Kapabacteria bacterium]